MRKALAGLLLLSGAGLVAGSAGVVSPGDRGSEGRSTSATAGAGLEGGKHSTSKFRKQQPVSTAGSGGDRKHAAAPPAAHGGASGNGDDGRRSSSKKKLAERGRVLQRLLQDLEESDYAGIGSWGAFTTNPRRRQVSRSFKDNAGEGGPVDQQQQPQQQQQQAQQQQQQQQGQTAAQAGQQVKPQQAGPQQQQPQQAPPQQQQGAPPQGYPFNAQPQAQMEGYWSEMPPYHHHQQLVAYEYMDVADGESFDTSHIISLGSVLKIGVMLLTALGMSYMAVVPRTAPTQVYNYLFKINMLMLTAAFAPVLLLMGLMYNPREVNVNNMVHMFFSAFTWGYGLTFLSEIMAATGIKLSLLKWLDGGIFEANPEIPPIYMPWLWKEHSSTYRPRLTTLLASDVLVNGLLCPVIEEAIKLLVFRVCSRRIRQKARGGYNDPQPCVHSYIVHMVVVALGLKVADNNRRILLYTKPEHASKPFFALARGVFPVHELCGAFTALNLVRRDILGQKIPTWRLLAPAVVLHSMANFRGMKPIYKWASSAPWTEMQLQALSAPDYATALQQIWKAAWGLVWFAVLARVLGYLMYRVSRCASASLEADI